MPLHSQVVLRWTLPAIIIAIIFGPWAGAVRAGELKLTASLGIAGRYRAGSWLPVTVRVTNTGLTTVHGQVQVLTSPMPGNVGATSIFARPVDLAGLGAAPQDVTVYVRNIDPARDDITIQLVDGRERGDGRVLAKAEYLTTTRVSGFSGIPVGDTNLFLVGFSNDPAAFNFLNGQKWGLMHEADGPAPLSPGFSSSAGSPPPPEVQVAGASAADLPDRAAGYEGVDAFLLRSDAPLDQLSEAQVAALTGWIASGGLLIVSGGDPSILRFGGAFASFHQSLGVRHYGTGTVVRVADDLAGDKFFISSGPAAVAYWRSLMANRPASLLARVAAREENTGGDTGAMLSNAVMRAPALDAPGIGIIALFLLGYIVLLVPVNYLVLKRLDKKEWAWVTIPLLVILFAVGTYGVGYAAKGNAFFLNRANIVETTADQSAASVYSEIGLFSPRRATYDIDLPDPNALAASPGDGSYDPRVRQDDAYGQTRFVEDNEATGIQGAAVNMWAMRAYDVQTTAGLGGVIHSTITYAPDRREILGTVTNHTGHDLSDCAVQFVGRWQAVGDLPRGGTVTATLTTDPDTGSNSRFQIPTGGSGDESSSGGQTRSQMQTRLRAGLADFARNLGQDSGNREDGNVIQAGYTAQPNEAILIGWCSDKSLAGPAPQINGRGIDENDASMVVVHIPVK